MESDDTVWVSWISGTTEANGTFLATIVDTSHIDLQGSAFGNPYVAGGTADLARLFADRVGSSGSVVLTDINGAMLAAGRDRLLNEGRIIPTVQCDAEKLPFPARHFDCVCIGFGLRNVTHKEAALAEMRRVLKPGGVTLILEFSRIWPGPARVRLVVSTSCAAGEGRRRGRSQLCYLAESIRVHPDQPTLKAMMEEAGFERVDWFNLATGAVALHRGRVF
jgi:demethylmenaquinone methyltransferase/2-methoxy-6-polyprenyl-1,4-benzoquinol methylase